MRAFFYLLFFIGYITQVKGQEYNFLNYNEPQSMNNQQNKTVGSTIIQSNYKHQLADSIRQESLIYKEPKNSLAAFKKKVSYSLNVGMQVGMGFNKSYFINQYLLPTATIQLNKNLKANIGIGYFHNQYFGKIYSSDNELVDGLLSAHTILGYSSLIYGLNDKTDLVGSVMFGYDILRNGNEQNNKALNIKEATLGVNYKVTKSFSISAQVGFGNRPEQSLFFNPGGFDFISSP